MEDNFLQEKSTDMEVQSTEITKKAKKLPLGLIIAAIVGVIAVLIAVIVIKSATSAIPLDEYVVFETSGYDGYGSVRVRVDWDAVEEKYGDKVSYTEKARADYGGFLSFMTPVDLLADCIKVKADVEENLSNGDVITYTWEPDEDLYEYLNCKIKAEGGTYTVSGLEEIAAFDAFSDLKVSFTGAGPNGKVNYEYMGNDLKDRDFSCSTSSGLKNGDTVTISITNTNMESFAEKYGRVPEKLEQEYVVSGLSEYVTKYSELSNEFVSNLKEEAEETIKENYSKNPSSNSVLNNLKYIGYVFNVAKKEGNRNSNCNELYLVYSGTVSSSARRFEKIELYFPVLFTDLLKGGTGFSYEANKGVLGSAIVEEGYRFAGDYTPWLCYTDIIEKDKEHYTVEAGGEMENYAGYKLISKLGDIDEGYRYTVFHIYAMRIVKEYVETYYNGGSEASDIHVIGEYLLTAKNQDTDMMYRNKYIIVCAATVSNVYGNFETTTVYYPVEFDGVIKFSKDEYLPTYIEEIIGESTLPNSWYGTKGYVDGTKMYADIITANKKNYTYEITDGLKEFGQ